MTRAAAFLATLALIAVAQPALAALKVGAKAPDFTAQAALAGKEFRFVLSEALSQGPVVVYFYPKSFTKVCTEEANAFAEASADFAKLGARVLGVSADPIDVQKEFSSLECRDKFAVAADPDAKIIQAYEVKMPVLTMARRISYVIAPDGRILSAVEDSGADRHVSAALAAVRRLRGAD